MTHRSHVLLASFVSLGIVAAQEGAHTESAPAARAATFVLDAGTHEIPALIDRVAEHLQYNILYNQNELGNAGAVRTTRRTEVDRQGCWELFGSLLYHKGLAILPLDPAKGFYEVVGMQGPRAREIATSSMYVPSDQIEQYANQKATPILTSVALQNINATIATNALRPFFAQSGGPGMSSLSLGNVGNNSHLLVQGYGPQVAAACRLLRLVDVGGDAGSVIQVVRLEHAPAQDIVARLDETLGPAVQAQMQQGMTLGVPFRSVAHPALNAVILSGTEQQVREALTLVARLDAPAATEVPLSTSIEQRLRQLEQRIERLERQLAGGK